ncbi:MAG: hypothetical protein CMP91_04015 [Gammaproteobacteria bacterium]|nr:hypothetical protein [Gammaproteobacteria bacterium]MAY02560.1 hypothetical protein [Gammaproteobacteria bacterium]
MNFFKLLKKFTVLLLGPLVIAGVSAWLYLHGGRIVTTDNAYIRANISTISSEISGKIIDVKVQDNQSVNTGEVLFRLAEYPYFIEKARAEAELENIYRDIESQKIEYQTKQIEIARAEIEMNFYQNELQRMTQLLNTNAISTVQYDQAQFAWQRSKNDLDKINQELLVAAAKLIDPELPTVEHPQYRKAKAALDQAELNLSYTTIKAPADGVVVNVSPHIGENIIMGSSLARLVDDQHLWIEANFKETDLTYVEIGQPVEITIDTYPNQIWHGRVASITPATGSEFSLLPAQNSSGNWVKVVQRITVNIEFDELNSSPLLSSGMSAEVKIETQHTRSLPWISAD